MKGLCLLPRTARPEALALAITLFRLMIAGLPYSGFDQTSPYIIYVTLIGRRDNCHFFTAFKIKVKGTHFIIKAHIVN